MKFTIMQANMSKTEDGYVGSVHFTAEGHKFPYEMTLHSKKGKDWAYALFFLNESGSEEQIDEVDEYLDTHDEAFDALVEAAMRTLAE